MFKPKKNLKKQKAKKAAPKPENKVNIRHNVFMSLALQDKSPLSCNTLIE